MSTTAAAKVFAIPELLENILLELSDDSRRAHGGLVLRPAKRIFGLIRVNSTFKATIEGSPQSQRLLGLEHQGIQGYKVSWEADHYSHVQWLLGRLCGDSTFNARGPNRDNRVVLDLKHLHVGDGFLSGIYKGWSELYEQVRKEESASWKHVLVSPFCNAAPLKLMIRLEFSRSGFHTSSAEVCWEFYAGDKLGDVFCLWSELFDVLDGEVERTKKLKVDDWDGNVNLYAHTAQRVRGLQFSLD